MATEIIRYNEEYDFHYEKRRGGQLEIPAASHLALALAERGDGTLGIRGKHYRFSAGDILIIAEGRGCTVDCGEATRITLLIFRPYFLSESLRAALKAGQCVISAAEAGEAAAEAFGRITAELRRSDKFSKDACRAYTTDLLIRLARLPGDVSEAAEVCPAVESVLTYVKEHYAERLSLSDMAAMCKVSVSYLSRKFKAEVGVGFADHISSLRLERAEDMLRERPEMTVTEIAFLCGFNDSNYFSDKFKNRFGMSPLKFRKTL